MTLERPIGPIAHWRPGEGAGIVPAPLFRSQP